MIVRSNSKKNIDRFLVKVNRYSGYILIPLTVGLLVSGYRMVGYFNFFSRGLADLLHRIFIHTAFVLTFSIHTFLSLRHVLMRRNIKGVLVDILLIIAGVGFAGYFIFLGLTIYMRFGAARPGF